MKIPVEAIDLKLWRKAIQHLQSLLETETNHIVNIASFSPTVCPIYRPDLEDVAYYEFEVYFQWLKREETEVDISSTKELATINVSSLTYPSSRRAILGRPSIPGEFVTSEQPSILSLPFYSQGFIIVATGEHDFPIAHCSFNRPPVSRQFETWAQEVDRSISRIYKLDSLSYVAEDFSGELITHSGQIPIPINLPTNELESLRDSIGSAVAEPKTQDQANSTSSSAEYEISFSGENNFEFELRQVSKWQELREIYPTAFEFHLQALQSQAASSWQVDQLAEEFGEGIFANETYSIVLLSDTATTELSGDGAQMVEINRIEHSNALPTLELVANVESLSQETRFNLQISYENGIQEELPFFIVMPDTPSTGF
ncbi:hypothetical protein N836_07330 [Leptolyngbya sp. Heron Island J]|uniref:hypothetical protein n=1 Tax=Leptolyngbya sp. Heron Island J TaxID=1385935 RepID=UPI0003B94BFD|nr:hypothetical protein [Leptolyngbya sp. Heron Island J]ESA36579.1 hypothetical protein N836_07330 [Leptolyngbya sp. Heron Island J]